MFNKSIKTYQGNISKNRNYFLIALLVLISSICYGQDTAIQTFKIRKIYATAAGRTFDTIDRQELLDSGGVAIHGCSDCKISGFRLIAKFRMIKHSAMPSAIAITDNINPDMSWARKDTDAHPAEPDTITYVPLHEDTLYSKTELFTWKMRKCIRDYSNSLKPYYIEIDKIKIQTLEGEEMIPDKICLYLR